MVVNSSVAVGVGIYDQKPEILIHLERLKSEGHDVAAELLSLARIIR